MADEPQKHDTTIPGGAYIVGGHPSPDGKHYGGRVVDAEGKTLAEFDDDEENPGAAAVKEDTPKDKAATAPKPSPAKPQPQSPPAAPPPNPPQAQGK